MSTPPASRLERLGAFLQIDPDNRTLLRDYASEAMRAGEFRACARALERLRGSGERSRDDAVLLARALRLDGCRDDAIAVLTESQEAWPGEVPVAVELAACHFAERAFESALDDLPSLPDEHEFAGAVAAMRVRLLHHLGRLDEAVAIAQRFLGRASSAHDTVAAAAVAVLLDLSRLEEARAVALSLVDAAGPDTPPPYEVCEVLAAVALDEDQPTIARGWLQQALGRRQDDGRIWLLKGVTELRAGGQLEAIDALQRAVDLMPSHPGSHLALGWAWLAKGDFERAQSAFESGLAASPAFAESHGSLAVLAAMRGQTAEAAELIRRAQRLDRHCASARWAEQLLAGHVNPEDVSRLAAEVVAYARRQRQPSPTSAAHHS